MTIKNVSPLTPLSFFTISAEIPYLKKAPKQWLKNPYLLPDTSAYLNEESFAKIAMGWNEDGFLFHIAVEKSFEEACFPEVEKGDGIEIFIDTRDLKSSKVMTRFCHHFVFLPKEVGGVLAKEVTSFRGEDSHALADSDHLKSKSTFGKGCYTVDIEIPTTALCGFEERKVGFNYRITRPKYEGQHFAVSSRAFAINRHPSLWGTLNLGDNS